MLTIQALGKLEVKKKVQVKGQNGLSSESQDNLGCLPKSTHTETDLNQEKLQLSTYHPRGKQDSVEVLENHSAQFSVSGFNNLR